MSQLVEATLEDLYREPGKAELIDGRIVRFMASGYKPGRIALRIVRSLDDHAEATGLGVALGDNVGFAVDRLRSRRQSFCPDAAFYSGPLPENEMRFIEGPPTLAVEVRSENDYGDPAEEAMARKRADYFEAGTEVVWDVDPIDEAIRSYRKDAARPLVFRRGDVAHAEPAVPAWTVPVDRIFG